MSQKLAMLHSPVLGVLLFAVGLAAYFIEFGVFKIMRTPYIFLIPATIGSMILALSWREQPGLWRAVLAAAVTALTVMVWWLALVQWRTPDYEGPATPGKPIPAFATTDSSGAPWTDQDLRGPSHSLLVFYRGRW